MRAPADLTYQKSIKWGRHSAGHLVHISQAANGLACDSTCPACHGPLVAKQGAILEHHYAHQSLTSCGGPSLESQLHIVAKEMIYQRWIDVYGQCSPGPVPGTPALEPLYTGSQYRADVGDDNTMLEVVVTHDIDAEKDKYLWDEFTGAVVRLQLADVPRGCPPEQLWRYITERLTPSSVYVNQEKRDARAKARAKAAALAKERAEAEAAEQERLRQQALRDEAARLAREARDEEERRRLMAEAEARAERDRQRRKAEAETAERERLDQEKQQEEERRQAEAEHRQRLLDDLRYRRTGSEVKHRIDELKALSDDETVDVELRWRAYHIVNAFRWLQEVDQRRDGDRWWFETEGRARWAYWRQAKAHGWTWKEGSQVSLDPGPSSPGVLIPPGHPDRVNEGPWMAFANNPWRPKEVGSRGY